MTTTAKAGRGYRVALRGGRWRVEAVVRHRPGGTGLAVYRHYHGFETAAGAARLLARILAADCDPSRSGHWERV